MTIVLSEPQVITLMAVGFLAVLVIVWGVSR